MTTQTVKYRVYVKCAARANWCSFLDSSPRNDLSKLPVHDIPDGSDRVDLFDQESERIWADDDRIYILGTPLDSEKLISAYLKGKERKHRLLMDFIKDVAAASFPREAEQVLKGVELRRRLWLSL